MTQLRRCLGPLTRAPRGGAQSFHRLTSQLQPRTRVRLIAALNLHDGGNDDEARERHGLSGDAVLAWREQAAAAGRGAGGGGGARGPPPAPRHRPSRARSEEASDDSRTGSGSGSGSSGSGSGSEDEDDDAEAEYEALARIAREWEAAERERAAREEDAKDLATMMRLCCIAMKPTAVPADNKGEGRKRNTAPPMRQRNGSIGTARGAPRAPPPPPPPYREPPAVEARRAREEQRDTSQNRHRQRAGPALSGRAPRDY